MAVVAAASVAWGDPTPPPADAAAPPAASAPAVERPKYQPLRFNEDWSVLGRGAPADSDWLDPIKYLPLSDDGSIWASFGGQVRERFEGWGHYNFGAPAGSDDHDTYLLSRFLFHGDLHIGEHIRLFAEGKSALSFERDLVDGRRTLDDDHLDLQNAFADFMLPLGQDGKLTLRAGRQELLFGAQRLVSPLDWSNTRRTFDGFSGHLRWADWNVTGFWTRPVIIEKYEFNDPSDQQEFFGIYATGPTPWKQQLGMNVDLYWLGLHRDTRVYNGLSTVPVGFNGTAGSEERQTLGGRLFGKLPQCGFDYDVEGAYQFGKVGSGDVDAWMIATQAGYTFGDCPTLPRLYVGFDYASGDKSPGGDVQTFNQLFPLGHAFLGYIDTVGRQNIIDVSTGLSLSPIKKLSFSVEGHLFWRAEDDDALYNAGGGVVRAAGTSGENEVGSEIDLLAKYQFNRHLLGMLGYSHFFAGPFIEDTGPSEDIDFVYVSMQYTF
jgi:hypothetical protein